MIGRVKRRLEEAFQWRIRRAILPAHDMLINRLELAQKSGPQVKIAQQLLCRFYEEQRVRGALPPLSATGYRVFSEFEEDGKLLFIFAVLGIGPGVFLDIGAANGINSNCANLAINCGWRGVFVDGDEKSVDSGRLFYQGHPDTKLYPPAFVHEHVTRENVNRVVAEAGLEGDIDFLSIDIDGNDYWIWEALECVTPKVVMIETHVEFGLRNIVVPYDKDYVYPGAHPDYHGASPPAMVKLAYRKGYRLVGSNLYGFNTIYVLNGQGEDVLPEVSVESILEHPRNIDRARAFEPIKSYEYLEV